MKRPAYILPLIVVSQFAGTSLWFAVNAVLPDIFGSTGSVGHITSVIQFGFIIGTLIFAVFSVADRFSASHVFFFSSIAAAVSNVALIWASADLIAVYSLRFMTGFFMAGIYPVGMKIAADWFEKGLGKALGYLVGALVLGTAFPNLLKSHFFKLDWKQLLIFTSAFATIGGSLILFFVGDGPYRKVANRFEPSEVFVIFRSRDFRAAAFGYFGHMWELYTFWSFVPALLLLYDNLHQTTSNIYLWAFVIIAIGSLSCVMGGYVSQKTGSSRVAFYALVASGLCCLISFCFPFMPSWIFYAFMLVWGSTVIADSPQFSTLIAQTAPPEFKGTALTIVTSVGFAITIVSIQLLTYFFDNAENKFLIFLLLAPGPIAGIFYLRPLLKDKIKS